MPGGPTSRRSATASYVGDHVPADEIFLREVRPCGHDPLGVAGCEPGERAERRRLPALAPPRYQCTMIRLVAALLVVAGGCVAPGALDVSQATSHFVRSGGSRIVRYVID